MAGQAAPLDIAVIVTPGFNMAATVGFLDPLRAANYLNGGALFRWSLHSVAGGEAAASNGLALSTRPLAEATAAPDIAVISSSWTPEAFYGAPLDGVLRRWLRFGAKLCGLDTGGFLLANAGLLTGRRATVHYEHIDAFAELFPDVTVTEDLYAIDGDLMTCCGGAAAGDLALQVLRAAAGDAVANAAARYVFHERMRAEGAPQLPEPTEPFGATAPTRLRKAIRIMEANLEEVLAIPEIAARAGLSQRQLERLFNQTVCKSPQRYYSDIRLDRARGLVTQTDMPLREIALACGFASPEHFSRAYRARFGISARSDRVKGRIPFEFRAWPMHPRPGLR
ncbi:GlxA family transcriptional regulator [Paralimibaculum aggregatum]|uniref:GlxA family transcriptional regulator n=1 Tax=Paralimibaculum aggregatum TaxID=3036245 RepID=A0ABQ6LKE5_9RHOB|nr:GlxA family transcriptional regulator [Limibaculum sp. NKW23]GMG81703.1 GlxA family transcriptional regulator [Limibaculum sp. NKW23]